MDVYCNVAACGVVVGVHVMHKSGHFIRFNRLHTCLSPVPDSSGTVYRPSWDPVQTLVSSCVQTLVSMAQCQFVPAMSARCFIEFALDCFPRACTCLTARDVALQG